MCTTKVSPTLATMSPLAAINMPELSMATWPWGSLSTAKISPAGAATARCTSSRSGMCRLSHPAGVAARGRRRTILVMAQWWSIEVMHGGFSAFRWQEQHDSALIEAAVTNGARDGTWHADEWGVVFEVLFDTEEQWETFRGLPVVRAALDAVPDPVNGLLIYRGRGGGAGAREPRRPRPAPSAGAISLPESGESPYLDLTSADRPG